MPHDEAIPALGVQRILITGKNGQLGFELQRALAPLGHITAVGQVDCDLANETALRQLVQRVRPHIIVNPAAYTAVDKAEGDSATAHAINTHAPRILGEEAAKLGACVVHYSTDYVFDGQLSRAYTEQDAPNPQSVYGQSKWAGEQALQQTLAQHLILRTSWVVGAHGNNFAKTMLKLAANRPELRVVADQWGAPTSAALLADCTAHLVRQMQHQHAAFAWGLYHLTASGHTNWCQYAQFVIAHALAQGTTLAATPDRIHAIGTADYPTPAQRPLNSRLSTQHFEQTFGLYLPAWQQGVAQVLNQILMP
jgi:dTDP-4-dehydrorhamnose reductase